MKYVLIALLLVSHLGKAQSNLTGLGRYVIGVTTPDSLNSADFNEQDESYVKGTLTLVCSHIRSFSARKTKVAGIEVANLVLYFYDNTLFRISCPYSNTLKMSFLAQHGPGLLKPETVLRLCPREPDKLLSMWSEAWQNGDITALVVHRKGYTADCEPEESASLIIASQKFTALSSECELRGSDPFLDEYLSTLKN
ncbi:hypothetical protein HNV11_22860 [Spirosoma taeanense]|uniref:Uncharacterized protein n=1 Tax=Spirosoma taeanense TaxID=2735870 RepID=A0A6M5YFC4_9BACT|nr:hypothetical protein [Spirosoma taeanense]QJW92020.1 hypothetical protein HNV11_22860 [Spirosoma taeanense]